MSTTFDIRAPAEQTEGTRSQVLRWLKAIGDEVSEHEPLIELETDKVTVEIAAPASGVLREIVKGEQEEIEPGEVLGRMEVAGVAVTTKEASLEGEPAAAGSTTPVQSPSHAAKPVAFEAGDQPAQRTGAAASLSLSPAVRRLLTERNLNASDIQGSGEGGRITIDDILAHTPSASAANPQPRPGSQPEPLSQTATSPPKSRSAGVAVTAADSQIPSHTVPHTAIRKRIAEHMVQSLLHTAPHVTTVFEANLSAVMAHRASQRAAFEKRGAPLTFTAYFLAAAVEAIRAVPEANSRWTDSSLEIYDAINIGVAAALESGGLVVPVLRNIESRNLFDIAEGLHALVTAAREGRLQPADVRGGTFTISNHGVSGSLLATPIVINQPQSAILGVGKLEKRAVVVEENGVERIEIQPKCYVTLTIDHRVMDGHQANRFLQTFVRTLEAWPAR